MSLYFRNGKPNLWFLTGTTVALGLLTMNAYSWSFVKVKDSNMANFLRIGNTVLYRHYH